MGPQGPEAMQVDPTPSTEPISRGVRKTKEPTRTWVPTKRHADPVKVSTNTNTVSRDSVPLAPKIPIPRSEPGPSMEPKGKAASSEVPTPSKSKEPAHKSGDPRPESVCIPEKPAVPVGEPRGKEETGKRKAEEESGTLSTVEGHGQVA